MSRGTQALISRAALRHNYAQVEKHAPDAKIWAVVKANAYGHDARLVAQVLSHANGFAVSTILEAKQLRESGVENPIILLEGVTETEHWADASINNFEAVVHYDSQIDQLQENQLPQILNVWIKVDTGMHRLGFAPERVQDAIAKLATIKNINVVGTMTHLACADESESLQTTASQVSQFQKIAPEKLNTSIGNSAGLLRDKQWQGDWVRPGIMLYGSTPLSDASAESINLKPVMKFESPVIAIRTVKKGERIGYGHRWQAEQDSVIATLAVGYGDGYPRHAPNGTPVWLNGKIVPLSGRVSMDMIMVDATDLPTVQVGDVAELWGDNLSVDEVAKHVGTIGYELLTRISSRVEKILID